ncbi:MAG: pyridoxine 5'-phosphate synthase [bacterium]|nr:pyridoxine 5'-phosphate synthase [bacterium]
MAYLSVNLDTVGALREIRRVGEPDPCQAAMLAELAGADGITVQMQRNRKTIRERDLYLLKGIVKTRLTIEMPPVEELIDKAVEIKPWMITFVTDHANVDSPVDTIDFGNVASDFRGIASSLKGAGISPSFFVEPEAEDIRGAAKSGAEAITINCQHYAEARTIEDAQRELDRIDAAAQAASKAGLTVMCGRGLSHKNVVPLSEIDVIDEFVVGFSICSRAMLIGMERAVREMKAAVSAR